MVLGTSAFCRLYLNIPEPCDFVNQKHGGSRNGFHAERYIMKIAV